MPILAIGPHVFAMLEMDPQKISEKTVASWPAIARFGAAPGRQFTGLGEDTMTIEGLIFNQEFGGYSEYLALKGTQRAGVPLPLIGWGSGSSFAQMFGQVVVLEVSAIHEYLGPDGIGRKIGFTVELGAYGDDGPGGGLF